MHPIKETHELNSTRGWKQQATTPLEVRPASLPASMSASSSTKLRVPHIDSVPSAITMSTSPFSASKDPSIPTTNSCKSSSVAACAETDLDLSPSPPSKQMACGDMDRAATTMAAVTLACAITADSQLDNAAADPDQPALDDGTVDIISFLDGSTSRNIPLKSQCPATSEDDLSEMDRRGPLPLSSLVDGEGSSCKCLVSVAGGASASSVNLTTATVVANQELAAATQLEWKKEVAIAERGAETFRSERENATAPLSPAVGCAPLCFSCFAFDDEVTPVPHSIETYAATMTGMTTSAGTDEECGASTVDASVALDEVKGIESSGTAGADEHNALHEDDRFETAEMTMVNSLGATSGGLQGGRDAQAVTSGPSAARYSRTKDERRWTSHGLSPKKLPDAGVVTRSTRARLQAENDEYPAFFMRDRSSVTLAVSRSPAIEEGATSLADRLKATPAHGEDSSLCCGCIPGETCTDTATREKPDDNECLKKYRRERLDNQLGNSGRNNDGQQKLRGARTSSSSTATAASRGSESEGDDDGVRVGGSVGRPQASTARRHSFAVSRSTDGHDDLRQDGSFSHRRVESVVASASATAMTSAATTATEVEVTAEATSMTMLSSSTSFTVSTELAVMPSQQNRQRNMILPTHRPYRTSVGTADGDALTAASANGDVPPTDIDIPAGDWQDLPSTVQAAIAKQAVEVASLRDVVAAAQEEKVALLEQLEVGLFGTESPWRQDSGDDVIVRYGGTLIGIVRMASGGMTAAAAAAARKERLLSPAERSARHELVNSHMAILEHAVVCDLASCQKINCCRMKVLLAHNTSCPVGGAKGGCSMCRRIWALVHLHAKKCNEHRCAVPHCLRLRQHMQDPYRRSQTPAPATIGKKRSAPSSDV